MNTILFEHVRTMKCISDC